jgi:mono/diheme cytochrome c family protein
MKKLLLFLLLGATLLPLPVYAQTPADGGAVFQQKCTGCHTIGGGNLAGPDLQGVTTQRDADWLTRWMMEPDKMLAEGDPIAAQLLAEFNNLPMPNLGLTPADAASILAYLENPDAVAGMAAAPLPPGEMARGQAIFLGQQPLTNGGPACLSCHSIGQVGLLGGGTLGPDLTRAAYTYGDPGLAASLQSLPFPTMQGIFTAAPLTPQETADLNAFLVDQDLHAAPQPAQQADMLFGVIGLVGSVGLLAAGHFTWRNRQGRGIRRSLVENSLKR